MTEDVSIKTEMFEPSDSAEIVDPRGLLDEVSYDIPLEPDSDQLPGDYGSTHLITADSSCSTLPRSNAKVKPWFDDESKDISNCDNAKYYSPSSKMYTNHRWDSESRSATKSTFHDCSDDCTMCAGLCHQVNPVIPHDEVDPLKPDPDETSAEYWSSGLIRTDLIRSNALPNCAEVKTEESMDGSSVLYMDTNHSCDQKCNDVAEDSINILAGEDTVPKQPTISGNTDTRSDPQMIGKFSPSASGAKTKSSDPLPPMSRESAKRPAKIAPGAKPYACNECSFRTAHPSALKRHRSAHTGDKAYAGDECGNRSSRASGLKNHMATHTGDKPYACDECGYRTVKASHLKHHMATHTGAKPYACNECRFRTAHPSALKKHTSAHTGEKPYGCDICSYRTAYPSNLEKHLRTHTDEKPYACDECSFRTVYSTSLTFHLRSHTGERPHACNVCSYRAADSSSLKKHMRTHTGEKPYACSICSYRASQSYNVKLHIATHCGKVAIEDRSCVPQCSDTGMISSNTTKGISKTDKLMSGLSHHVDPIGSTIVPPDEADPHELSVDIRLNHPIKPDPDEPAAEYGSNDFMTTDSNRSEPLLNHDEVKTEWVSEVDLGLCDPLEINPNQPPCEPSLHLQLTVPPDEGDSHELSADISSNVPLTSDPDQPSTDITLTDVIKMEQPI